MRKNVMISSMVFFSCMVVSAVSGMINAAYAETMAVSVQQTACKGRLSIASETGATGYDIGPNSDFSINVTPLSRIVAASIVWQAGLNNSLCLAYCQLYVNNVKHTQGSFVIYNWTTSGPQYSFTNLGGTKTGTQRLVCVRDSYMDHLPKKYGEFPLP